MISIIACLRSRLLNTARQPTAGDGPELHIIGRDFTAAEFRDKLDDGRRVAIMIPEVFDRHGITIRRGELRRTMPQRLEQYGSPSAV